MEDRYHTLSISIHRFRDSYQVELSHADPSSRAQVAPTRREATFDMAELLALLASPADYGSALSRQLFCDRDIKQSFLRAETAAQATDSFLRLSLRIDPSAQELLQGLRWELLRHPHTDAALATSERILFSRFMLSHDCRPIRLRARADLSALIVVSAPPATKLERMGLTPVDFPGEVARTTKSLAGVKARTLGGPSSPCTLDRLIDELRPGVDILYLVSHGMFRPSTGAPELVLQAEDGGAKMVKGGELAERIAELQTRPRLVVLASCQSGGDGQQAGPSPRASVQATLAGRLADAGVPAIIAMQGFITKSTIETMMPVFFAELLRDGQIDRALAVARGRVRGRDDGWMPALYTRLLDGRIWYTAGFGNARGKEVWRLLLEPVRAGKVVPILGPGLLDTAHGSSHDTATQLAKASNFPLAAHEWEDLPRVTEYMSVTKRRFTTVQKYKDQLLAGLIKQHRAWLPKAALPEDHSADGDDSDKDKPKLGRLLALVGDHLREQDPADPYRILAELPASVYVTTNFDPLLERALKANERDPQQVLSRWRWQRKPLSEDDQDIGVPTRRAPLVYHVFGAFGKHTDGDLVLTEDDYFDFLIETSAAKLVPKEVEGALVNNSLLFLGFRLTDWHFRVLFRLMMSLPSRELLKNYCHVAVQLDPHMQTMTDVQGAKDYLAEYFGQEANIDIYWGRTEEFLKALRDELAAAGDLSVDAEPEEEDDDEWNF